MFDPSALQQLVPLLVLVLIIALLGRIDDPAGNEGVFVGDGASEQPGTAGHDDGWLRGEPVFAGADPHATDRGFTTGSHLPVVGPATATTSGEVGVSPAPANPVPRGQGGLDQSAPQRRRTRARFPAPDRKAGAWRVSPCDASGAARSLAWS